MQANGPDESAAGVAGRGVVQRVDLHRMRRGVACGGRASALHRATGRNERTPTETADRPTKAALSARGTDTGCAQLLRRVAY